MSLPIHSSHAIQKMKGFNLVVVCLKCNYYGTEISPGPLAYRCDEGKRNESTDANDQATNDDMIGENSAK